MISVNIPTQQHGGATAEEVNSASLLLYQSSTLGLKAMAMAMAMAMAVHDLLLRHGGDETQKGF